MQDVNQGRGQHLAPVFKTTLATLTLSVSLSALLTQNAHVTWPVSTKNAETPVLGCVVCMHHAMSPIICLFVNVIQATQEMHLSLARESLHVSYRGNPPIFIKGPKPGSITSINKYIVKLNTKFFNQVTVRILIFTCFNSHILNVIF